MGDQSVGGRRLDLVDFDSKYDYNNARSSRGIVHDGVESLHLSVDHNVGINFYILARSVETCSICNRNYL